MATPLTDADFAVNSAPPRILSDADFAASTEKPKSEWEKFTQGVGEGLSAPFRALMHPLDTLNAMLPHGDKPSGFIVDTFKGVQNPETRSQTLGNLAGGLPYIAAGEAIPAAAKGAPGAVVRGAVKAAAPEIATGAVKVATGAAADAAGMPGHIGTALGLREGLGDIIGGVKSGVAGGKKGLAEFRAAQEAARRGPEVAAARASRLAAQPEIVVSPQAPPPGVNPIPATATATGRVPGPAPQSAVPVRPPRAEPAWVGAPESAVLPVADATPIPTELPSGRKPGSIANQVEAALGTPALKNPTLGELHDFARANKLGPLRGNEVAIRKVYQAAQQAEASASPAVAATPTPVMDVAGEVVWDPQRGHVYKATGTAGKPPVETIPFSKEAPLPEQMAQKARDLRAPITDRLAEALTGLGTDAESVTGILTDTRKAAQLRALAKTLGIDLPKDLTRTVQELQSKMKGTK